jgi:hypothetical protein
MTVPAGAARRHVWIPSLQLRLRPGDGPLVGSCCAERQTPIADSSFSGSATIHSKFVNPTPLGWGYPVAGQISP